MLNYCTPAPEKMIHLNGNSDCDHNFSAISTIILPADHHHSYQGGAYGRNIVSRLFRHSHADLLIKSA